MWYHLLTSIGSSTLSTLTIDITYMDDGTFIKGISIDLTNAGTGIHFISGETNSSGRFVVNNVPSGTYTVTINGEDDYTFYINSNTFKSYSIVKSTNVSNGLLYNWLTVNTGLLAPSGWHVPTQAEFQTLHDYVTANGYSGTEGDALKSTTGWTSNNGVDVFGFNWKPSGRRSDFTGLFYNLGDASQLWSSDSNLAGAGLSVSVSDAYDLFYTDNNGHELDGFSIRFVRDSAVGWSEGEVLTDLDGNIYNTVQIGTQIWTVQNYACTQLNDGTPIDNLRTPTEWSGATGAGYCAYNNNSQNVFVNYEDSNVYYGRIYNGHALFNASSMNYTDVYVPSLTELNTLETYLTNNGYSGTAAKALKSTFGWGLGNDGTDDFNFTQLPSGYIDAGGIYSGLGSSVSLWSSTVDVSDRPYIKAFTTGDIMFGSSVSKDNGHYIPMLVNPVSEFAVAGSKYTDLDGNIYDVIQIGTQHWLAQRWACTQYADGSPIPEITDNTAWSNDTTGARCDYDNDESYIYK